MPLNKEIYNSFYRKRPINKGDDDKNMFLDISDMTSYNIDK